MVYLNFARNNFTQLWNREMNAENVSSEKFSRSYSGWLLQQCETRRDLSCVRTLHTWFCVSLCLPTTNPSANKQTSWFYLNFARNNFTQLRNREMNAENVSSEKFSRSYSGWLLQQCETRRDLSCVHVVLCVTLRRRVSMRHCACGVLHTIASSVVPIVGSVKTQAEYTAHYGQFLS